MKLRPRQVSLSPASRLACHGDPVRNRATRRPSPPHRTEDGALSSPCSTKSFEGKPHSIFWNRCICPPQSSPSHAPRKQQRRSRGVILGRPQVKRLANMPVRPTRPLLSDLPSLCGDHLAATLLQSKGVYREQSSPGEAHKAPHLSHARTNRAHQTTARQQAVRHVPGPSVESRDHGRQRHGRSMKRLGLVVHLGRQNPRARKRLDHVKS